MSGYIENKNRIWRVEEEFDKKIISLRRYIMGQNKILKDIMRELKNDENIKNNKNVIELIEKYEENYYREIKR